MSTLYLIRHGQASFGTDDYDRLSDRGRLQAMRTGEYFQRSGIAFDAIYSGSLKRQRDTAGLVMQAQPAGGELIVDPRFNEIDNDEQFEALGPFLASRDPALAELLARSHSDSKSYQKVLAAVFEYWVSNDCSEFGIQTWGEFSTGVRSAIDELMSHNGSGCTVAVFSSGGTIASILAMALGLESTATYKLYEPMFNCAISQLLFSGSRLSLASFNETSHLRLLGVEYGESLVSYR